MITLLADANIQGQVARLVSRMQTESWRDFWDFLDIGSITFSDAGLHPSDRDSQDWQRCQEQQFLLLTSNRNQDGPDSLEATIRLNNTQKSLPVFTIADADRIQDDPRFADCVIDRLLRYLLEIGSIRGTGRLYLP